MKVATFNAERAEQLLNLVLAGKFEQAEAQVVCKLADEEEGNVRDVLMVVGTPHMHEGFPVDGEYQIEFAEYSPIIGVDERLVVDGSVRMHQYHAGTMNVMLDLTRGEDRTLAFMHLQCAEAGRLMLQE